LRIKPGEILVHIIMVGPGDKTGYNQQDTCGSANPFAVFHKCKIKKAHKGSPYRLLV
jgi:hypothetical protein